MELGIEVSGVSTTGMDDAIAHGIAAAAGDQRTVISAVIKELRVVMTDGGVSAYHAKKLVSFILAATVARHARRVAAAGDRRRCERAR